jgi:hypothetical protein
VPAGRDDDALTWDGDEDPTLDVGPSAAIPADEVRTSGDAAPAAAGGVTGGLPDGFTAVGKGSEDVRTARISDGEGHADGDVEPAGEERAPLSSAALIGLGIFGGVYLLLTIGWLLGAARLQLVAGLFLDPIAFQFALWLAVAALPLWFVTVLWFTRTSAAWVRFALLGAGAVLLIPWPFVLAGAAL